MARIVAYRTIKMQNVDFYYGSVQSADADEIVVSDGAYSSIYEGSFRYDDFGNVYGTLSRQSLEKFGSVLYTVSDINCAANRFYSLASTGQSLAAMEFALSRADQVFGSDGNDYLLSFDGSDRIQAGRGRDIIGSGAGDDRVDGGIDDDMIVGGRGADRLIGGAGSDEFKYYAAAESTERQRDTIGDFEARDTINLKQIDADTRHFGNQTFAFIGDDRFSGTAGELRVVESARSTHVSADVNGDGVADLSIRLVGPIHVGESDLLL